MVARIQTGNATVGTVPYRDPETRKRIAALRDEAGAAGNWSVVALCNCTLLDWRQQHVAAILELLEERRSGNGTD